MAETLHWETAIDIDFDSIPSITFHVGRGKCVEFVKRKKGKWELLENGKARCSECGTVQSGVWDDDGWDHFCRRCGADMRQETEDD